MKKIIKPTDRDFIETVDDLLFCVVGYMHPPDGYTAYLKYVPSNTGKWEKNGTRYQRVIPYYQVSQVENTYEYLKNYYPKYLLKCPVRNIETSWVPKQEVKKYFKPIKRMQEIEKHGPKDKLEEKLSKLVSILSEQTGLIESLGVTGSILTNTHNPEFSDMDITVHGLDEAYKIKRSIETLKKEAKKLKPISRREMENWVKNRVNKFNLNGFDLLKIAENRWNYGYYLDTYFSVHPIRKEGEIKEKYGDNTYHRRGEIKGTATITDASESIYLPAIYKIKESQQQVSEIVSFEGLFGGVFFEGDKVKFKGVLEEVKGRKPHFRIIVGGANSPDSYIKWVD